MHARISDALPRLRWRRSGSAGGPAEPRVVADGGKWRMLVAPLRWEPAPGDVLIGSFAGFMEKQGSFGPYRAVILNGEERTYMISGTMLVALLAANDIEIGEKVRVVYAGTGVSHVTGHPYKKFEAYVAE